MLDSKKNSAAFSHRSDAYAAFRPTYPAELFSFLAGVVPGRGAALDVGTGSGQAAVALADYFERVIAVDASAEQLSHAKKHRRVEYRRMPAESLDFPAASFDLVTVALALHWFDLDSFWPRIERVLKKGGVFAAWGYGYFSVSPELDEVVKQAVLQPLEPYWSTANKIMIDRYRSISFPFEEIPAPPFELIVTWDLDHLLGFISTWSAVKRYADEAGGDVIVSARAALEKVWPKGERRVIHMPLALRVGRKVL